MPHNKHDGERDERGPGRGRRGKRGRRARGEGESVDYQGQAARFLLRLEDREVRRRILPKVLRIAEGDWQALVDIGAEEGFEFTIDELKAVIPDSFFRGAGKSPRIFWDRSTLDR
ncbi:MAG: Nif11-like leader peptide family natural product precursor [Nannocystaceae bacterium]